MQVGRPRDDWELDPVVESLMRLTRSRNGVRDEDLLAEQHALVEHAAIRQRIGARGTAREALRQAMHDIDWFTGALLTREDLLAVRVLLNVDNQPVVDGEAQPVEHGSAWDRARIAAKYLGHVTPEQFRRGVPRPGGGKRSLESDLLTRLKSSLDVLDAPQSASAGYVATPARPAVVADGCRVEDLLGTWSGRIVSPWLLKHQGSQRPSEIACHMTVTQVEGGLAVRWLNRDGSATLVTGQLLALTGARRLICAYEAQLDFGTADGQPSHRGACLLETGLDDAEAWSGPYWTDRRTHGELVFTARSVTLVETFAEGEALVARADR